MYSKDQLIQDVKSVIKTGTFQLASGKTSNIYLNLKELTLTPAIQNIGEGIFNYILTKTDAIGGLELGSIPITISTIIEANRHNIKLNGFIVRKKPKNHGTLTLVEGNIKSNENIVIVDDVATSGMSLIHAAHVMQKEYNCKILSFIVVVDRQEGARELIEKAGFPFHALCTLEELGYGGNTVNTKPRV